MHELLIATENLFEIMHILQYNKSTETMSENKESDSQLKIQQNQNLRRSTIMDYTAHYEKSPRLWSQGLHAHDYYELYLHLNGGRYYCIDDTIFELKPNQLLIIPPLHMHGLVCDHDLVNYERCYLYLSPELLFQCGFGRFNLIQRIDEAYQNGKFIRLLSAEDALLYRNHLQKIEESCESPIASIQLDCYSMILKVLQIVEYSLEISSPSSPSNTSGNPMQEVLHYVNDHYTENLSVSSISRYFHMSESFLSHSFKEYTNKGLYEYILYKRILKAKELMCMDISLTEIAFQCGFSDYSNFLRIFKKIAGESPRSYRNHYFLH